MFEAITHVVPILILYDMQQRCKRLYTQEPGSQKGVMAGRIKYHQ